LPCSWIIL